MVSKPDLFSFLVWQAFVFQHFGRAKTEKRPEKKRRDKANFFAFRGYSQWATGKKRRCRSEFSFAREKADG